MPELPEVETVKRSLEEKITGLAIENVQVIFPKVVHNQKPPDFKKLLIGRTVEKMGRRGKYLLIYLSGSFALVIHLRMTGRLVLINSGMELPKYTHVVINFNNNTALAFADMRKFGRINLLPSNELKTLSGLKDLGPEPLGNEFTLEYLTKKLQNRRTKIKAFLLNQRFIAGLGNIYADEALYSAKIHPERSADELTSLEINRLYHAIIEVLQQGIANRGTSFRDYVDGEGKTGSNQNMLQAYNREGQPCHRCGAVISRKKVAGRSSYFCPHCQKL